MRGLYTELLTKYPVPFEQIVKEILTCSYFDFFRVEQFCDDGEEGYDVNRYNVYKVFADDKVYVLKKSDDKEIFVYENFLKGKPFHVPEYYGNVYWEETRWILIEYLMGKDLREFKEHMISSCAEAISQIMNTYWESNIEDGRFGRYLERINRRFKCLDGEPILEKAYQQFLNRQQTCPRTLSHGDLLQYNVLYNEDKVYLVDWAFAGVMPYSLDIARFIAHGTVDKRTFPFYMNEEQKKQFVEAVYCQMGNKIAKEQYLLDIKMALLNEYVEFLEIYLTNNGYERGKVFTYYYEAAHKVAEEILGGFNPH